MYVRNVKNSISPREIIDDNVKRRQEVLPGVTRPFRIRETI